MRRHDSIRQDLQALGHSERTAMLLVSVVEHEPEAIAAAQGVTKVLLAMCRGMNGYHRSKLAAQLIEAAAQLKSPTIEVDVGGGSP